MIRPLISVCIATYNGEKFIVEQLKTILSQLTDFDEIIISDDHSSDCTLSLIRSFRDPRIKIYLNENDKGYTSNFENALKKATGEIIFIADQDDIWKKDKVDIS
ncbi:glycosyltransferase, partial [Bacteroides fragilis]